MYKSLKRCINTSTGVSGFKQLLIFIASMIVLFIHQPAYTETLTINASQVPPYHTPDSMGFEDQLVKEIYRRLGYSITIRDAPAARSLILVNDGIDDGSLARNPNMQAKFPNMVQFSEHALERRYVAFTKLPDLEISGWDSLENYSVGIVNGWKILEKNIKKYKKMTKVRNSELLFKLLENHRADVVVFNKWGGLRLIKELGLQDVRLVEPPFASKKVYFYLNKRHANLAVKASDELRKMKEDGTYDWVAQEVLEPWVR